MSVARRDRPAATTIGDELVESMRQAFSIAKGEMEPGRVYRAPAEVDVRQIRDRLGLSQTQFAARFGFAPGAVRDWEQKRRRPEAAARILLRVIEKRPEAVEEVLREECVFA